MKVFIPVLLVLLLSMQPARAADWQDGVTLNNNPFVAAMLVMMKMFGLLDAGRDFTAVPYAPGYWNGYNSYLPGNSPFASGMYPMGMSPMGASPMGMSPMGASPMGMPGVGAPWSGMQGGRFPPWGNSGATPRQYGRQQRIPRLDGIWETHSGGLLMIRNGLARLYTSSDRHQDMQLKLDGSHIWLLPQGSRQTRRYEYRIRDGYLVLRDDDGSHLVLRPARSGARQ